MATIQAVVKAVGGELLPDSKTHHNRFHIKSSSSNNLYVVSQKTTTGEWQCACPGWIYKKPGKERGCKHLTAMMPALLTIGNAEPAMALPAAAEAPKAKAKAKPKAELTLVQEPVAIAPAAKPGKQKKMVSAKKTVTKKTTQRFA